MPKDVYAEVAPRLERGHLFSPDVLLDALSNVDGFIASQQRREAAKKLLESRGFKVLADNTITLTVAISEEGLMEFARSIGQTNRLAALMAGAEGRLADDDIRSSFLELSHSDAGDLVAGIAIAPPVLTSAAVLIEPTPPHVPYDHILAPRDLVDLLRVAPLHAYGNFGNGIRVTVVDSGCFVDHPFFADIGAHIRVELGPGSDHPQIDEIGHGTLVCGNLVSIAPRSEVTVLKTADNASLAGFK